MLCDLVVVYHKAHTVIHATSNLNHEIKLEIHGFTISIHVVLLTILTVLCLAALWATGAPLLNWLCVHFRSNYK